MKWSLRLGTVAGIGIFVHWTFFLLIAFILFLRIGGGDTLPEALLDIGFVFALFGCVVLHELGHALTARHYGVQTRDITLLPIGGVARLESIPEVPMQEFWVAVAGPAVNVVIAAVLFVVIRIQGRVIEITEAAEMLSGSFLTNLMMVNIFLVLFNMLPAFPMDGGRVLRALLATRMSRVRATYIAANVGQAMAILFGIIGIFSGQIMLLFIAMFVYMGAQAESHHVEMRSMLKGARVRDAMIKRFRTLGPHDSLLTAVRESSAGLQKDFPVVQEGGQVAGMIFHQDVVKALTSADGKPHEVSEIMRSNCPTISDSDSLEAAVAKMQLNSCPTLLVLHDQQLVGLLSQEHLGRWVSLHGSLNDRPSDE